MSTIQTSLAAIALALTAADRDAAKTDGGHHNHEAGIRVRHAAEKGIQALQQLRKDVQVLFPHHIPVDPTPTPAPAPAPVDPTPAPMPTPVDPTPTPVDPTPAPTPVDPVPVVDPTPAPAA